MTVQGQIKKVDSESNIIQRIVVAIIAPVVFFFLGYGIMTIINSTIHRGGGGGFGRQNEWGWKFSPTDFSESWWGWIIVFCVIGTFEYFWFRNRPNK